MDESRIRELIDACRPGSQDLVTGDMQELKDLLDNDARSRAWYEKTQANDAAIRQALHQVNVPADLASRLMARLTPALEKSQADTSSRLDEDEVRVPLSTTDDDSRVQNRVKNRGWSRRRWLVAGAAASAAAIGGLLLLPKLLTPTMNASELIGEAPKWIEQLDETWNEDRSAAPPDYPFSTHLSVGFSGWQRCVTTLDDYGTAYRLSSRYNLGKSAVLFVTAHPHRIKDVTATPPANPLSDTAGQASGLWREKDRLYVLVVPGSARQYRSCFKSNQLASISF